MFMGMTTSAKTLTFFVVDAVVVVVDVVVAVVVVVGVVGVVINVSVVSFSDIRDKKYLMTQRIFRRNSFG